VLEAMQQGVTLPAIEVYKLGDRYYVVDGNHRAAAARRTGLVEIDAAITEFQPVGRPADAHADA
jgi:ParB-like chromosome segregation protein Spo0J